MKTSDFAMTVSNIWDDSIHAFLKSAEIIWDKLLCAKPTMPVDQFFRRSCYSIHIHSWSCVRRPQGICVTLGVHVCVCVCQHVVSWGCLLSCKCCPECKQHVLLPTSTHLLLQYECKWNTQEAQWGGGGVFHTSDSRTDRNERQPSEEWDRKILSHHVPSAGRWQSTIYWHAPTEVASQNSLLFRTAKSNDIFLCLYPMFCRLISPKA